MKTLSLSSCYFLLHDLIEELLVPSSALSPWDFFVCFVLAIGQVIFQSECEYECSNQKTCTIVSVKFYFTAVVLCMMHVSSAASHVPAVQQHPAAISALFTVSFPVAPLILWFAVWSGSHLTLSALLSHIPPGCQVLHWQAAMMVSTTAKGGRGWTGNEWTGFNPARGLLNTCVAVSHSWVVNPCGSWKNEDFSFLEVIVGLVSNTSFQFQ